MAHLGVLPIERAGRFRIGANIAHQLDRLAIGRLAVYDMLERGIIPAIRQGRRWIITIPAKQGSVATTSDGNVIVIYNAGPQNRVYVTALNITWDGFGPDRRHCSARAARHINCLCRGPQ